MINKEQGLTEEEKEKVLHFENYLLRSKKQEPYLSEENLKIVANYEKEMEFLKALKEKNPNQKEAIDRSQNITSAISIEEEKQIEEEKKYQESINKEQKLQTNAGFLNASVLIYITINLGLLIVGMMIFILK